MCQVNVNVKAVILEYVSFVYVVSYKHYNFSLDFCSTWSVKENMVCQWSPSLCFYYDFLMLEDLGFKSWQKRFHSLQCSCFISSHRQTDSQTDEQTDRDRNGDDKRWCTLRYIHKMCLIMDKYKFKWSYLVVSQQSDENINY